MTKAAEAPPNDPTDTVLYTMQVSSALLGRSVFVLRDMDAKGRIKTVRSPGGHRLIPKSEVDRVLAEDAKKKKQAK